MTVDAVAVTVVVEFVVGVALSFHFYHLQLFLIGLPVVDQFRDPNAVIAFNLHDFTARNGASVHFQVDLIAGFPVEVNHRAFTQFQDLANALVGTAHLGLDQQGYVLKNVEVSIETVRAKRVTSHAT